MIGDASIPALLDTGCNTYAVLNYKTFQNLKNESMVLIDSCHHLQGPNEQPLETHGHTTFKIKIENLEINIKAIVATITQHLILGAHFLNDTRAKISFINHKVTLYEELETPIQYIEYPEPKYNTNCKVIADVNNLPITPRSVAWIPVKFSPYPNTDLVTVCQIHHPYEGQILSPHHKKMRYINDTDEVIWIQRNTTLGWYTKDANIGGILSTGIYNLEQKETGKEQNSKIDLNLSPQQAEQRWELLKTILEATPFQISEQQKEDFYNKVYPIQFVLALEDEPLGLYESGGEVIRTNCNPIRHRARPLTPSKQIILEGIIRDYKERQILTDSDAPWSSPISLVPKKNGEFRLVCDYRKINKETIFDCYPLPNINHLLSSIPNSTYYSTLDLKMGYHQLKLSPSDSNKSTIITPNGLYKFRVLPMGLTNASQYFMRTIQNILKIPRSVALVYLDDVIIFGDTVKEHTQNLLTIFNLLYRANIKIHALKSKLFQTSVSFLGHLISKEGLKCTEDKLKAIKDYPTPQSPKECRKALGLFGYLRKFCPNYGIIAKPIFELTAKTKKTFIWTQEAEEAFLKLKELLTSPPILAIPTQDDKLVLTTDVSARGIGAVLQVRRKDELKPIAFASQALKKTQRSYSATKLEAYAIVHFVQHFKYLLIDKHFEIQTDHRPLIWLHNFKDPPAIVARWLEILGEYKYDIVYKPGTLNECADALSRIPQHLNNIEDQNALQPLVTNKQIKVYQEQDADLKTLKQILQENRQPTVEELMKEPGTIRWYFNKKSNLQIIDDCLTFANKKGHHRIIVPRHMRSTVLKLCHDTPSAGHRSARKIVDLIKDKYHWIDMNKNIEEYVKCCETCGLTKKPPVKPKAKLVPTVTHKKWETLQIDIVGPFTKSRTGNKFLLTAICTYTKFARAWPLPNTTSETIAKKLVNDHFCIFGIPQTVHSDNGANFCSDLMKETYHLLGIRQTRSHTYCAFNNAQIERWHHTLEQSITTQANKRPRSWDEYVALSVLSYNSQPHSTTSFTPFKMMFGEEARLPLDLMFGPTPTDEPPCPHQYVDWLEKALIETYNETNKNLQNKMTYMKKHYDEKAYGPPHQIGDHIWILKGRFEQKKTPKLATPYKGPYIIQEKLSNISYKARNLTAPYETCLVHYNRTKRCHLSTHALSKYIRDPKLLSENQAEDKEITQENDENTIMRITEDFPPIPPLHIPNVLDHQATSTLDNSEQPEVIEIDTDITPTGEPTTPLPTPQQEQQQDLLNQDDALVTRSGNIYPRTPT